MALKFQTEEYSRYNVWAEAVINHPSVKAVQANKDKVLANARPYAEGNAKSELADAVRKGSTIP